MAHISGTPPLPPPQNNMIKQLLNKLPLSKPSSKSPPNHPSSSSSLPPLTSLPPPSRPALFLHKLSLSTALSDPADSAAFELKRQLLLDLVDYLSSSPPRFTDPEILAAARMISANLFRPLPSSPARPTDFSPDPDDDPPSPDPSWPHLHLVYDFLLHFLSSQETDPKLAKRHFDRPFVLRLLNLFDSEDHSERDYLKSVLHRFYGKFMTHRPFIRKAINDILYCFIFETQRHNGIAELLEILGSVINGFALPLKEEHKMFLARALVPLHKPKCVASYHHQLSYCVVQFVEKDVELADVVIRGILKYWPVTNSLKEVMFIGELEEILEAMDVAEFRRCMVQVFRQIGRCLNSSHFQVAERALFLWNNDHINNLITQNRKVILPIIFQALERNTRGGHWNLSVQSLSLSVRKLFLDADQQLFNECLLRFQEDSAKEKEVRERREQNWRRLEDVAASKSISSNEAVFVSQMISSLSLATKHSQTVVGI